MKEDRYLIKSRRVVFPDQVAPAGLLIAYGRIERIIPYDGPLPDRVGTVRDFGDLVVMPGLIDMHVHLNEPGRTEWEGFGTGTRAAMAGGVTTLVDMPLNSSPVTTTLEAFEAKLKAAKGKLAVDCAFYAGVVPDQINAVDRLLTAGCVAGKAFMIDSGIDEFAWADRNTLVRGMRQLARQGKPLLAHAEVDIRRELPPTPWRTYADYLASRPPEMEGAAIKLLIDLCRATGCAVHIVHLATAKALPMIREAKAEGLPLTVETAPHYLNFAAEEIDDGRTDFKCAPPIRSDAERQLLIDAVIEGDIDVVATDHSPCPPDLKGLEAGDFAAAWGGISSLQLLLPATWQAISAGGGSLNRLAEMVCQNPAKILGLTDRGQISLGKKADLVIWSPDTLIEVDAAKLQHRHKLSPYTGRRLSGAVHETILSGGPIYRNGEFLNVGAGRVVSGW